MGTIIDFNNFRKINNSTIQKREFNVIPRNRLYILIGIPGSGKTTFAKKYLNKINTVLVSTDEIRKKLTGTYSFSTKTNERVFTTAKRIINDSLLNGFDVIFDATNTKKEYRKDFIKIAQDTNSDAIAFIFNTPLSICLKRNSARITEKRVPDDIIIKMANSNLNVGNNEGFSEIHYINH